MKGRSAALVTIVSLAVIGLVYLFIVSAGTFSSWPTYSNYYDLLAEGFRAGRLDIPISPSPRLLAAENPFDPSLAPLWMWDATLHEDRYYFYWGPLPALIEAVVKAAFGISRSLGDQYAVFVFSLLQLTFGCLILLRLARRLFPDVPASLVGLAILVLAFANPIPHSLASPAIYQAAILGGQAFLLGGMLFAFDAVSGSGKVRRDLIVAGVLWALAIACRVSVGPAVALLVVATALALRSRSALVALGTPVGLVTGILLFYNHQRFGSWLDFGVAKQLTTIPYDASASYVPLNLFSYALRPFDGSCEFPYAFQVPNIGEGGFPDWMAIPTGYMTTEPLVGMLVAVPWSWLAPVGMSLVLSSSARANRVLVWCAASFAILGTVTGAPGLVSFIATMRYLGDVTPGMVLSGVLGAWWLHSRTTPGSWPRRLVVGLIATLGVATVLLGFLLGFQGYNGHFRLHNPALHDEIVRALSFCGSP